MNTIKGQPSKVYIEVAHERTLQEAKWGVQNHHPLEWLGILGEEFGEVSKAAIEAHFQKEHNPGYHTLDNYREELIQVAAVAIAMVESLDRTK